MSTSSFLPRPISVPQRSFLERTALMPFSPAIWREARTTSFARVFWSWLAVAVIAHFVLSGLRSWEFGREFAKYAPQYDKHFDPVVYENGTVRVDGPRLPRFEERDSFFIVDPEETVPLSSIKASQYVVVRRTEILRKDNMGSVSHMALHDLADMLGHGPIVVKSETIAAWWKRNGLWIQAAMLVFFGMLMTIGDAILCPLIALLAGAVWFGIRGRGLNAQFGDAFRMAFACTAMTVVVGLVLNLLGHGAGICFGLFLWPALVIAGCFLASIHE
jgi:hypothetical protein